MNTYSIHVLYNIGAISFRYRISPFCRCQVNFFQGSAVAAWLGFAITFVARPFGGVVLGTSARSRRLCRVGRYRKSWETFGYRDI